MIYATPQGEHAHSELQHEIKQAKSAKWYRRLKIIQLSLSGASVSQLSDQFDLCPATIRSYIKAYNGKGIESLRPKKQPGRPTKVGHLSRDDWAEILSQTPNQLREVGNRFTSMDFRVTRPLCPRVPQ